MKAIHTIVYTLIGLTTLSNLNAQDTSSANQLNAVVQFGRGRPVILPIEKVGANNKFFFKNDEQLVMEGLLENTLSFQWQTPVGMSKALLSYHSGDMPSARTEMARVKKRYQAYQSFKMNPASQAALYELRAAIRLLDWPAVKQLVANFPGLKSVEKIDQNFIEVAAILGNISDKPAQSAAQIKAIKAIYDNKSKSKGLTLNVYGMLRYAEARAIAAQISADQFTRREVNDNLVADCSKAVDLYCQAAMAQRGKNIEFLSDSLHRASILLSIMPGVRDYTVSLGSTPVMNSQNWSAGSVNFRDAANIAFVLRKVLDYKVKDRALDRINATFYNPAMKSAK